MSISSVIVFAYRSFSFKFDLYRPMKKCVRPVRNAPTAMRKQPAAMSLGRCSLAPKWLTTARNNKLPTHTPQKRLKSSKQKEWLFLHCITKKTIEAFIFKWTGWCYPSQNCRLWDRCVCWRGQSASLSEWWSSSCRFLSGLWRNRRRKALQ